MNHIEFIHMKKITYINLVVSLYVTALFILFQPSILELPIDIIIHGDQYILSLFIRFIIFFLVAQITIPIAYYLSDHLPHHPV